MSVIDQNFPSRQISLVHDAGPEAAPIGQVMVLGPFPPLIGPTAGHASALLHMFKASGYRVRSACGPGLALAAHNVSFASDTRLRNSSAFLDDCKDDDVAVVYAKSLDFSKVSKPRWYKRRLEEIRRLKFLALVVTQFNTTALVLDKKPQFSRSQLSLWLLLRLAGLLSRRRIKVFDCGAKVGDIVSTLTGKLADEPTAFEAEETAYSAAFVSKQSGPRIKLSVARAELALNYWQSRATSPEQRQTAAEVSELIDLVKRSSAKDFVPIRLLTALSGAQDGLSVAATGTPKLDIANAFLPEARTHGVPITQYMKHLWITAGSRKKFRLRSRQDAEALLNWYLFEAPQKVGAGAVPIPPRVAQFYLDQSNQQHEPFPQIAGDVIYTKGRDHRPFALSNDLAGLAACDHQIARKYDVDVPFDRTSFVIEVLLTQALHGGEHLSIGRSAEAYLCAPIGKDSRNVSRLEFFLAVTAGCQLEGRSEVERPWQAVSVRKFAREKCCQLFPGLANVMPAEKPQIAGTREVSITGLPRSETGVGSNLHMSVAALGELGLRPQIYDTAARMARFSGEVETKASFKPKRSFALHHVNADLVPQAMLASPLAHGQAVHHVGYLLWEFASLPESHRLALDLLDEIWTPTSFLEQTYAAATDKPVVNMRKGLLIPSVEPFDLEAIGANPGATTFLVCFDFHSSVARKNPLAAVRAFHAAFPKSNRDVQLIVKTTPEAKNHWGDPERQMIQIRDIAAKDDRIKVVPEYYSFNRLLSLIAWSDCLVSSHRAEGFGLIPAYALGLGRPVIATDYSGTKDFCNETTAFPMPYQIKKVQSNALMHPMKHAVWAEIEMDALMAKMRAVAEDVTDGLARAAQGRKLIQSVYSPEQQAERYRSRLKELGVV